MNLPDWNDDLVLPPIQLDDPASRIRSPYVASMADLVRRFGNSRARSQLLKGLLDFRGELYALGITSGFQWIDGSFTENVEVVRSRPPEDVDAVTFLRVPESISARLQAGTRFPVFDQGRLKRDLCVDAYFVSLNLRAEMLVDQVSYWYGLLSHQRETYIWKGFVHVNLDPASDANARSALEELAADHAWTGKR